MSKRHHKRIVSTPVSKKNKKINKKRIVSRLVINMGKKEG